MEIKREILAGELSGIRKAFLPLVAALGGMALTAAIYLDFNWGSPKANGWGIPMATDITLVMGMLDLLGASIPVSLKVFVTALAIVDDIGAILVIAFFYSSDLSRIALGVAGTVYLVLVAIGRIGSQCASAYRIVGLAFWMAFLGSGVHATVSGVLIAAAIPAKSGLEETRFIKLAESPCTGSGKRREWKLWLS